MASNENSSSSTFTSLSKRIFDHKWGLNLIDDGGKNEQHVFFKLCKWRDPINLDWRSVCDDKMKFAAFANLMLTHTTFHPLNVVKNRLAISSKNKTARCVLKELLHRSKFFGFSNLYKGFGVSIAATVPAQAIALWSEEKTKELMHDIVKKNSFQEDMNNFIVEETGVIAAALLAQTVSVPGDIVKKTLMVQGFEGHPRHKGAYDILSKILRTRGVTGLYKGYSLPFITPSLSIWWGTYNVSQVQFAKLCQDDQILRGFSHAVSGLLAGLLTSAFNQPFDVVSTRLQVHMKKEKTFDVVMEMYNKNGYRGFYKGLGPRACWVSITGAAYGLLCHCLKAEATVEVTKK